MIPTSHCLRNRPATAIYRGFSLSVPITSIREVRVGSTTDAFTQCPEVYAEDRCFSIIHGDEFSTLDLVFPTQEESIHWTVGLRYLLAKNSGIKMFDICQEDWLYNNSVVATQLNFNFTYLLF